MNITFLIGNGFDLACGLRTAYTNFVDYYLMVPSKNLNIELFKKKIEKDLKTWADAEYAFGQYTRIYSPERVANFQECRDDFIMQLVEYLGKQERRIDGKFIEAAQSDFLNGLVKFDNSLTDDSTETFINLYNNCGIDERTINVITFNYTNVFEKLIKAVSSQDESEIMSFTPLLNGTRSSDVLGDFIHIHGKRSNPPVIFGVDNESQIANEELKAMPKFVRSMIKPELNNGLHKNLVRRCLKILDNSSIICIYGMSIGLTDTFWWNVIVEWLHADSLHQLIYYAWLPSCIKDSAGNYLNSLEDCREYLYEKLLLSDDDAILFRDRIHIEVNLDLFGVEKTIKPTIVKQYLIEEMSANERL